MRLLRQQDGHRKRGFLQGAGGAESRLRPQRLPHGGALCGEPQGGVLYQPAGRQGLIPTTTTGRRPSEVRHARRGTPAGGPSAPPSSEAVAETDEELFEKYFSGEQFTQEEIHKGMHKGVQDGHHHPGVLRLRPHYARHRTCSWTAMCRPACPPPRKRLANMARTRERRDPVELSVTDEAPLAAFVFKTVADPFVGKLSYVKVVSGKLTSDSQPGQRPHRRARRRMGKTVYCPGQEAGGSLHAIIGAGTSGRSPSCPTRSPAIPSATPSGLVSFEKASTSHAHPDAWPSSSRARGTRARSPRACCA